MTDVTLLLQEIGKHPLADLQKILETSPNDEVARFHIAVIHNDLGKGYAALKNRNEACVNYKKSWEIGKVFVESGALNGEDLEEANKLRAEAEKCTLGAQASSLQ